ncbi:aryl-sulfate sulfotransferase [Halorarum halobium]|uniref:aryl-sulfate sulfotransferase n=1 Tax=Halorarum halobium TaxID=3075121 RepID=UPI0028A62C31|nr:aryl-sulfate sulfotransferase [Halobaculum sp. XH14]
MTGPGGGRRGGREPGAGRGRAAALTALLVALLALSPAVAALGGGAGGGVVAGGTGGSGPGSVAGVAGTGVQSSQSGSLNPCVGTISQEPDSTTLLTIQGARAGGKTASLMVGVAPNGSVVGVHNDSAAGRWWLYDVDPMANGDLLVATTEPGISVVERVDPATGEHESVRRLENVEDAHDVDAIGDDEYVTVDKGDGRNRVVVYNATREETVWEWRFENHTDRFSHSGGGPHGEDWTHVNDVDEIRDGVFMVSVRNFDQTIAIDRESKEILWTLGSDDDYDVLNEQHNPDYIEGENGTGTVLVADSMNDRVVEYARVDGEWEQTWVLEGGGLDEPRDADRLPNGNTLVTDRHGHRVVEVTPRGEVVWEFYTPWQPYDAERVGTDPGSEGPTMRQLRAEGTHRMQGSAGYDTARIEECYAYLTGWDGGSRLVPDDELWGETGGGDAGTDTGGDGTDGGTDEGPAPTTVPPREDGPSLGGSAPLVGAGVVVALAVVAAVAAIRRRG